MYQSVVASLVLHRLGRKRSKPMNAHWAATPHAEVTLRRLAVAITSGDGHALKMVGVEADPRTKYCDARGAACVAMPVSVTYCHTCGARQPSRDVAN